LAGDREREAGVAGVSSSPRRMSSTMRAVEGPKVSPHLEADAVVVQLADLLLERAQEELHEEGDFLGRAAPVLAREGEEREVLDA
jgi:hypothetical protein